jgi:hypothetical protein
LGQTYSPATGPVVDPAPMCELPAPTDDQSLIGNDEVQRRLEDGGMCSTDTPSPLLDDGGMCYAPEGATPQAAPPPTGLGAYEVVPDDFVGPLGPNQIRQSDRNTLDQYHFGDFNVVGDDFIGPLSNSQMTQSQYAELQSSWLNISHGQGMSMTGSDADKATMMQMMRDGISNIGNDTDPAHTIHADLGRHQDITGTNQGVMVDAFDTNQIDLSDIEAFPTAPTAAQPNSQTQTDVLLHILAERRDAALDPTADFDTHHQAAFETQNAYRAERGQSAILEQTFVDGTNDVNVPFADHSSQLVKFDDHNNVEGFNYTAPPPAHHH